MDNCPAVPSHSVGEGEVNLLILCTVIQSNNNCSRGSIRSQLSSKLA